MKTLDDRLLGKRLDGGWTVTGRTPRRSLHSSSYLVTNDDGRLGFMKVLDYSFYFLTHDVNEQLLIALQAFEDEKRLLTTATTFGWDRVIRLFHSGILKDDEPQPITYLIMELAEDDARCQMDTTKRFGYPDIFRLLHQVAVGLKQLHSGWIAHQDLKAENILLFPDRSAKIGDLGRALDPTAIAQHREHDVAGDLELAPPELLYRQISSDWHERRTACDLYLFGSLIVFLFTGAPLTPQILRRLAPDHSPENWRGNYASVLLYVRHAYEASFREFAATLEREIRDWAVCAQVCDLVRDLTDPDPRRRGDAVARARSQNPFDIGRFLTRLDLIAGRAGVCYRVAMARGHAAQV